MSEFNFKKFVKVGSKSGNNTISFNGKSYSFGFNSVFYNKNQISKYKYVILFYDDEKRAVAFQFTNDEDAKGAFTIVHGKSQSTGSVTAKSFILSNDINKPEYSGKKVPTTINDENLGELVVIKLLDENDQQV